MTEIDIPRLRETIHGLCFDRYEGTFAGGQQANNKQHLDRIAHVPTLRAQVVAGVAGLIEKHDPDLLLSVPIGGDWLTEDVAQQLGVQPLLLGKDEQKEFYYLPGGEETVRDSERLVIVDDVFNRKTNTTKAYNLPGVSEKAVAAAAIFNRNPNHKSQLALQADALIVEEIPDMLPEDHELWAYAP